MQLDNRAKKGFAHEIELSKRFSFVVPNPTTFNKHPSYAELGEMINQEPVPSFPFARTSFNV